MKRIGMTVFMALLLVFLITCVPQRVQAVQISNEAEMPASYQEMFAQVKDEDTAEAERFAYMFCEAYKTDRQNFLSALKGESPEKISLVVGMALALLHDEELPEVQGHIAELEGKEGYDIVVKYMRMAYDKLNALLQHRLEVEQSDDYAFDPEIVREFLKRDIAAKNFKSEGTFKYAVMMFESSPRLFIKTFMNDPAEDFDYVLKILGKGYALTGKTLPEIEVRAGDSEKLVSAIRSARTGIAAHMEAAKAQAGSIALPNAQQNYLNVSNIEHPTAAEPNEMIKLSMSVVCTTEYTTVRTWYLKVCTILNGVTTVQSTVNVALVPGQVVKTFTTEFTIRELGDHDVIIYVYSNESSTTPMGTFLSQKSINVTGYWRIAVMLEKNRDVLGTLRLKDAYGKTAAFLNCLGKSATGYPSNAICGHTPTGTYTGILDGPISNKVSSYGPYKVINMTGVSGEIISSGRDGIWIHGGDPASPGSPTYPYRPTYGCVRVTNDDQLRLQNLITDMIGQTNYSPVGQITIMQN